MNKGIAVILVAAMFTFSGCKKTVDQILLIGKWKVLNYYENGVQNNTYFTATYPNYQMEFKADNAFVETWDGTTNIGTWKNYNDDDKYVKITITATGETRIYEILELKTKTATVRHVVNGNTFVYDLTN